MPVKTTQAILLGYSGHGYVVVEAAIQSGIEIIGYAEGKEVIKNPYKLPHLGDETLIGFQHWQTCNNYILGVGSNRIRVKIAARVKENQGRCLAIVHPRASVADSVEIGTGTFIARNAAVNPLVNIGDNVILNTSCSIDHECQIGHNVHIAPGAVLAGNIKVGPGAFIGANSVIKEGISIGANAIIGAGSVVIKNVEPNAVVVGSPAKPILI